MKKYSIEEFIADIIRGEEALFNEGKARICNRMRKKTFTLFKNVMESDAEEKQQELLAVLHHENRYVQSSVAAKCLRLNIKADEAEQILESFANGEPDGTLFRLNCRVVLNLNKKGTIW
jgi:hypothetical protein